MVCVARVFLCLSARHPWNVNQVALDCAMQIFMRKDKCNPVDIVDIQESNTILHIHTHTNTRQLLGELFNALSE